MPRGGYEFLRGGCLPNVQLGFPELAVQARAIAAILQTRTKPGSRALLLYGPGLPFLPALFGCLYAGVIAVPAPPPNDKHRSHSLPRLRVILRDAEPDCILSSTDLHDRLVGRVDEFGANRQWILTDDRDPVAGENWRFPDLDPDGIAYLQYTSGSTASPRGVMLSHRQVLHNLGQLRRSFGYDDGSRSVTWMPHFHDYGLVEGLLQPLFSNIPCQILSPLALLRRPLCWLEAITRHRATHSHGPNFAYELCIQRATAEQLKTLELSSWQVAGNGAEPIRAGTLRRFTETFAPCGFRARAFYPAYGMAEATLLITARSPDDTVRPFSVDAAELGQNRIAPVEPNSPGARTIISCGVPPPDTDLRIVDPDTRYPCAADRVGEIWVAGPGIAAGYWQKPEETAATFDGRLAGLATEGPFLRTGDLGFLRDGELYVTGRIKDIIIVAGANHYPQDIEATIERWCPEVRRDHCVVFGITDQDEEQLVVLVEAKPSRDVWDALLRQIRRVVAEHHELRVAAVMVVKRGGIIKTSSGKLQRGACRAAFLAGTLDCLAVWRSPPPAATVSAPLRQGSEALPWFMSRALGEVLGLDARQIDPDTPFAEMGLDSRRAIELVARLGEWLGGADLEPGLLWQYPTVAALSRHFSGVAVQQRAATPLRVAHHTAPARAEPVAVIGMACRFPGAPDADAFWTMLCDGRAAIGPSARLPGVEAGFLPEVNDFDAAFFNLSASEARAMDPQQRLLLEVAWEAIEDAGLAPRRLAGRPVGVWMGISADDHGYRQFSRPDAAELITAHSGPGLAHCMAANRISYLLDLRGPSMAIDTACSSSLVAVHQACQSLRCGETEVALAGGVNLLLAPHLHLALQRAGMLSPAQRCKTFDSEADGYVRGEGAAVVVLKRLADAERDGDPVLAVILGSAVNQDGRSNGLTAPNPAAQEAVIRCALDNAGVGPADIGYVETHGTGTKLGDPIELTALQTVLGEGRRPDQHCLLGSVKTNIGHLEAAAGIAALVKVVLALRHGAIPPHLNLRSLNPLIRLADTPFMLASAGALWPRRTDGRRLAGVSSFGFGGTNAHLVVEAAAPAAADDGAEAEIARRPHLLAISAGDRSALRALAASYARFLIDRPATRLPELCHAAATGRSHHAERLALRASDPISLAAKLRSFEASEIVADAVIGRATAQPAAVVFLFTGQGAQYFGMGRRLYATQPLFRSILDRCDAELRGLLSPSLLEVLFGADPAMIDRTEFAQPTLFAVEYALARMWQHWGIEPTAVIGHSVGEYVAACLAGVFDLRTVLRLIAARGKLIGQLPAGGAMLAVSAAEELVVEASRASLASVCVAAVNGPRSTVLSGDRTELERLQIEFAGRGLGCRFLNVSHAFHSAQLDPVLDAFRSLASLCQFERPSIAWASNCSGELVEVAPDAEYWSRQMREPVRFGAGIRSLDAALPPGSGRIFLEIGPRPVLGPQARLTLGENPQCRWLPSLRPGQDDWDVLLGSLSQLYVAGVTPDWERFHDEAPRPRLGGLPTYPFQRQHFGLPPLRDMPSASTAVQQAIGWNTPATTAPPAPEVPSSSAIGRLIEQGDVGGLVRRLASGEELPAERLGLETGLRRLVEQHRQEIAGHRAQADVASVVPSGTLRQALARATQAEWRSILTTHLRSEIAEIIGVPTAQIADEQLGLFDMGFDSLMAVELKNRLETAMGQRLIATVAFEHPTLAALSTYLLGLFVPAIAPSPPPGTADEVLSETDLAEIENLSERDLGAFVDAELQRALQ